MEKELDSSNNEVIVEIPGGTKEEEEEKSNSNDPNGKVEGVEKQESGSYSFKKYLQIDPPPPAPILPVVQLIPADQDSGLRSRKNVPGSSNILDIPTTLQKADEDINRRSLPPSPYPKSKSRIIEPAVPSNWKTGNEKVTSTTASPSEKPKTPKLTPPITPKTPLMASQGEEDDEDDDVYTNILQAKNQTRRSKKRKVLFCIEFSIFVCVAVVLVLSKTVNKLENSYIWSLELWKWCVLILVVFCGRLFSEWITNTAVFLIEKEFLFKKKVLYFVYSLQKSVRVFIWLGLILLTWGLLINRGVHRTRHTTKVLNKITRGIASTLVGAGAWVLKTLFVKILASSFHVKIFFDRIQENIFHQYVLQILSGPPQLMGDFESIPSSSRQLSFKSSKNQEKKEKVIDVQKLQKMKRGKVSAWTMRGLMKVIKRSGVSTLSDAIDESEGAAERVEQKDGSFTCEREAQEAGYAIFRNVAKHKHKYIEEDDLLRFLNKEDVKKVLPLFEGAVESGKIKKKSFNNWVVNVYKERKLLALSLKDTKTAIEELNKLVSALTVFVLLIVWLLLMGIATTEVLVFISSQILLGVFMFGTSAKSAFEAIIFVFVMHPFDVGDRCVVDGVQVVVEEVNILTTVFLRYDNEKIFYPNSILATKAISNFNRSPEMSDSVEFDLDVSTSIDKILALKAKIKTYIESKPQLWGAKHSVRVREIENVNKMKMSLYVTHTINFQNHEEKSDRKSNLVLELKNIFEQLDLKYHLLPQEVLIRYVGSASPPATTSTRLL